MTLQHALDLHRNGRLVEAEQAYHEVLAATPDDADALHLLGVALHQRGADAEAAQSIRRAIALAPEVAQYHLSLGGTLTQMGEEAAALECFERALVLDPNSVEAHTALGYLHLNRGDANAAEARFRIGRRAEEEDPMLLLGLGNLYLGRGEAERALKFLSRAAERKPDDPLIQLALGDALFKLGNFAFADQAFVNARTLRPELSRARLMQARVRMREKRYEAAREIFTELLAADLEPFGANAGMADLARAHGQLLRALKYYRRAWAADPNNPGAANAVAWTLENLGDSAGAAECLSTGLQRAPDAHWLRDPLAQILERLGRADEAARVRAAAHA